MGNHEANMIFNSVKRNSDEALAKNQKTTFQKKAQDHVKEIMAKMQAQAPRVGTLLALGTTVPAFYFCYNLIWKKYNTEEFYLSIKKGVDWVNFINVFAAATYFGLEVVKFSDRHSLNKWVAPRKTYLLSLIPLLLSLGTLTFWDSTDNFMILPTLGSEISLLLLESSLVHQNLIPYWLFDIKYRLHIFTVIVLVSYYYSLKHLGNDIKDHPEKYQNKDIVPASLLL